MRRAISYAVPGTWPEAEAIDTVTLDFESRHRRRMLAATDSGAGFLLDLPEAAMIACGGGLRLEDGRWLHVKAAPEHLTEVRHEDARKLMHFAWLLGSMHLPIESRDGALFIRPDYTAEETLRAQGASLAPADAPFQPEEGTYILYSHLNGAAKS